MPTIDWLKKEFNYGYDSGDILNPTPDSKRAEEELIIGGSYRDYFMNHVLKYLKPDAKVLELGPGKGSWSRALLEFLPEGELHTVDFQDVTPWLVNDKNKNRLFCNQVDNSRFDCVKDNYFDLFFSFGVLCHNNSDNIFNVLKSALGKVKPGGFAIHQYGNWDKLEEFGWIKGRVPVDFKDKPDDQIWWPRNNQKIMVEIAKSAGWEILTGDIGCFQRDSVIVLRRTDIKNDLRLLNLGCGNRCHEKWQNYDFISNSPMVKACNLNQGIPEADNSYDVVYHSHVLEHFSKTKAIDFINECYRVLKPNGIIRVVVPDLEKIVEEYLKNLREAINGDSNATEKYEWSMLELYDQTVRNVSGGEMLKYWLNEPLPQKDYIIERAGSEVKNVLNSINKNRAVYLNKPVEDSLTDEQIGKFRRGGEVHQWMYDRLSLSRLLANAGFRNVRVCRAEESAIPGFNSYLLDVEADGSVRKPDSLFMEAEKI